MNPVCNEIKAKLEIILDNIKAISIEDPENHVTANLVIMAQNLVMEVELAVSGIEFAFSRLTAMVDALPEIIMEVDENKVYTWANHAGLEFFGPDVLGHEALFYFEGEQDTYRLVEPIFKGEENSIYVESWQRRIDGERRLLAWYCNALRDHDGKAKGAISSARDITELFKAEAALKNSEERYRLLVENSGIGVGFYLLDGKILYFNTKALMNMGGKPEDYIGKTLREVFGEEAAAEYVRRFRIAAQSNESQEYEDFVSLDSGNYWFLSNHTKIENPDGSVAGVQVIAHDITRIKEVQLALKESEEKFKRLVDLSPDAVVVHTDGKIVFVNQSAIVKMGAKSADDLLGKNAIEFVHPDYRQLALDRIKKIYSEHTPVDLAYEKFISLDGKLIDVETTAIPFLYEGKPAVQLIVRDVSEKLRMEQIIAESELKFRTLFESSHDALFLMEGDKFIECNQATLSMFSCTSDEIIGYTPFDFSPEIQPDGTPSALKGLKFIKKAISGSNQDFEWLHRRADGTEFEAEVLLNKITISGKNYIQASVRDISERKAAETELRNSETKYRLLADNMTDMVWLMDMDMVPTYVSPSIEKIRGFSFEELQKLPLEKNLTTESLHRLLRIYKEERPKVEADINYNYRNSIDLEYYKKDGSTFWLEIVFSVIRNDMGSPVSILCVGRDITEHKKIQDKLKESEEQLKFIANLLPVSIAKIGKDKRYIFINQSYCDMMQKKPSEVIGRKVSEVLSEQAYTSVMPHIETVLSGHTARFDLEIDIPGSGIRNVSVIYVPETDQEGNIKGFIATITDITNRKLAEDKIRQQLEELKRWQLVTLGREDRIMELKQEVNQLLHRLNEPIRYKSQENKITDV